MAKAPVSLSVHWTTEMTTLAEQWLAQCLDSKKLHYDAHRKYFRRHYLVGVPVIVITTIAGSAFFASLNQSLEPATVIFCGLVTILASVFAGIQTFLRYAERAEQHRVAAAKYGIVSREMQYVLARAADDREEPGKVMERWRKEMGALAESGPVLPLVPPGKEPADLF